MTQGFMIILSTLALIAAATAGVMDNESAMWALGIISSVWSAASIIYGKLN